MTAPQPSSSDQILIKLGEMGIQLAHIEEQLKPVADHEIRLRVIEAAIPTDLEQRLASLENARARIFGLSALIALVSSSAGTWLGLIIAHH